MSEALHILDRFIIHFFSAYGLVSGVWFLLVWIAHKPITRGWLPTGFLPLFVLSAMLVCLVAFAREPWDVHTGQWWGKAYFDFASWVLGCGVSVWGNYRLRWKVIQWQG